MCIIFFGVMQMKNDEYFMNEALKEADKAFLLNEVPIGAVIVLDGKIIARAHNEKDHKNLVTKHAELIAIEKASKKLSNWRLLNCEIYVTLEPCPMCASAIQQSRISRLIYGASSKNQDNFSIISTIFNNSWANASVSMTKNVLSNECSCLLQNFFEKKRIEQD